jgi:hypothetical protein
MLTEGGAPATVSYDLRGATLCSSATELKRNVEAWEGASDDLLQKLDGTDKTRDLLAGYGSIFSGGKHGKSEHVSLYTTSLFRGAHPHRAPPSGTNFRIVLFFTLSAPDCPEYDGSTQLSREKLTFLLYDEMLKDDGCGYEDQKFLLDRFVHYSIESAEVGAMDETFHFAPPFGPKWTNMRDKLYDAVGKRVEAEKELGEKIEALSVAEREKEEAMSNYCASGQILSNGVGSNAELDKMSDEMNLRNEECISKCKAVAECKRNVKLSQCRVNLLKNDVQKAGEEWRCLILERDINDVGEELKKGLD